MKKSTILYIKQQDGTQIKAQFTHQSEPLPTPHEKPRERELSVHEFIIMQKRLNGGEFTFTSQF